MAEKIKFTDAEAKKILTDSKFPAKDASPTINADAIKPFSAQGTLFGDTLAASVDPSLKPVDNIRTGMNIPSKIGDRNVNVNLDARGANPAPVKEPAPPPAGASSAVSTPTEAAKPEEKKSDFNWLAGIADVLGGGAQGYAGAQETSGYLDKYSKAQAQAKELEAQRLAQLEKLKGYGVGGTAGGKAVGANQLSLLMEGQKIPSMINQFSTDLDSAIQKGIVGPIAGNIGKSNPYAKDAQEFNAKTEMMAQIIGKQMEGGVLRAEDVAKYKRMLPQITDTADVAKSKLNNVRDMVSRDLQGKHATLQGAGYDTSGLEWMQGGGQPAAQAPAQHAEGTIIKNKAGERMIMKGGQWVKM